MCSLLLIFKTFPQKHAWLSVLFFPFKSFHRGSMKKLPQNPVRDYFLGKKNLLMPKGKYYRYKKCTL